jgi:SAM-dependent methyltransferase
MKFGKGRTPFLINNGYCPTCDSETTFYSKNEWLRDFYLCKNCKSLPRERALMFCLERSYQDWKNLHIHEASPSFRGASVKLKKQCRQYVSSYYFPDFPLGEIHPSGFRNENLEQQTFPDESFDLVVTQDVMEHIFHPAKAFSEIERVLKPGGAHIFSVPLVNKDRPSEVRARKNNDGTIVYVTEPEYHGDPLNEKGSLVTMQWGYDICDFIHEQSGLSTTVHFIDNISLGIRAEYIEILISRKKNK